VAAYVIAAIAMVMVSMVLFRMRHACIARLACGRKCESSQYGGSAQKEPRTHKLSPAYADCESPGGTLAFPAFRPGSYYRSGRPSG